MSLKLLLDTHIRLWSLLDPKRLSRRVTTALRSEPNELWLSPISTWELLILVEKGCVVLEPQVDAWLDEAMTRAPMNEAPLTHYIARESRRLDFVYQDPADKFLAATARVLDFTLVTADQRLIGCRGVSTLANR